MNTSALRSATKASDAPQSKSGDFVSFQNSPAKGVTSNFGDPCNSSKKRYQKVEPDWFWVYVLEMHDNKKQMVPKYYIKKTLKKIARKCGQTLVEMEKTRKLSDEYKKEAQKLLDMSKKQSHILDTLNKQLGKEVQDLDKDGYQDSSDDE